MLTFSSTDAAIIAVPMPMLWNLQVPLPQKLALGVLFSSGILVIFCTILRTYYFFGDSSNQFLGQLWSGREGFISMIIIATPGLWPLFRKMKWFGLRYKSSYGVSGGATGGQSHSLGGSRGISGPHGAERLGDETSGDDTFVMVANSGRNEVSRWRDNSEESIIRTSNSFRSDDQGQIRVTKEFTVKVDGLEQGRKN